MPVCLAGKIFQPRGLPKATLRILGAEALGQAPMSFSYLCWNLTEDERSLFTGDRDDRLSVGQVTKGSKSGKFKGIAAVRDGTGDALESRPVFTLQDFLQCNGPSGLREQIFILSALFPKPSPLEEFRSEVVPRSSAGAGLLDKAGKAIPHGRKARFQEK